LHLAFARHISTKYSTVIWHLPDCLAFARLHLAIASLHLAIWQLPDQVFLHSLKGALAEECTDSGRCSACWRL